MLQRQQSIKTIISYYTRNATSSGRGGALFPGAFHKDWMQHQHIFESLCNANNLSDEYKAYFLRLTPRAGELAF